MTRYYQRRFSQRERRLIPQEEIVVRPSVDEKIPVTTTFVVSRGQPLYIGLETIHQDNPNVLPTLVNDLIKYRETHLLDKRQSVLLRRAVKGLQEIIEPKEKLPDR